ncbi:hypothetical protein [Humisphaera borealis]|uniref:Uncharacterized protein n=1 Tax=Humisphaera borealis TaxID=2807512 RepID=A0A7M2WW31_9BACT|nr:hypothetical protein [Humisphaera borealis]QOV89422.1 hypothetical protein IPV69_25025 [Humisphaera borealis]
MASVWNRSSQVLRKAPVTAMLLAWTAGAMAQAVPITPGTRPALPATAPTTKPALPATKPVKPEDVLPTTADLHLLFEQEKYTDLLRHFPRLLSLRGKAAEPYNKWELYMLKFETHMRMKASAPALATLRDASEITDDATKLAWCKSVDLLIKRSKTFLYQPSPMKKEKPPAIDIIDAESRKVALKALLADELAVVKPKVEKAMDGRSIVSIAEAVQALQGFDVLELAAGGGNEESKAMIAELRTRGIALMAKTVIQMQANQTQIDKNATELIRYVVSIPNFNGGFSQQVRYRKRGLEQRDINDLKQMIKTTEQIIPNAKGLAKATGGQVREVEDLITAAEDLLRKTERTLNADYSDTQ